MGPVRAFDVTTYKYKAFISYSHADERYGEWLQRALERFRAPAGLVGTVTGVGEVPSRLTPIFRDRNDLPAAGDLNAEIQAALAASQFQIVLCSPNAARSRWVNEEVKLFKKLHGQERTLAVIVAGSQEPPRHREPKSRSVFRPLFASGSMSAAKLRLNPPSPSPPTQGNRATEGATPF